MAKGSHPRQLVGWPPMASLLTRTLTHSSLWRQPVRQQCHCPWPIIVLLRRCLRRPPQLTTYKVTKNPWVQSTTCPINGGQHKRMHPSPSLSIPSYGLCPPCPYYIRVKNGESLYHGPATPSQQPQSVTLGVRVLPLSPALPLQNHCLVTLGTERYGS